MELEDTYVNTPTLANKSSKMSVYRLAFNSVILSRIVITLIHI